MAKVEFGKHYILCSRPRSWKTKVSTSWKQGIQRSLSWTNFVGLIIAHDMINSNDDRKKNRGVSLKASLDVDEEVGEENYALQP